MPMARGLRFGFTKRSSARRQCFGAAALIWFIAIGLDRRMHASEVPSGTVLFFVGMPLLLGSWWGVALSPLFIVLFAIRAGIEERALLAGLPGYADYAARVRYRLLPGLW
jgi:hypothetical protein